MFILHSPTLILIQAIVQWLLAAVLMSEKKQDKSSFYWAIGLTLHGIGNILLLARPSLPFLFAILAYNICVAIAFSVTHLAFSYLVRRTVHFLTLLLPIIAIILTMSWYINDIYSRVFFASLISAIQFIFILIMLCNGIWDGNERFKQWLVISTGLFTLGLLTRAALCLIYPNAISQLLGTSYIQAGLIISGIVYSILSALVILLTKLARLNNELFLLSSVDSLTGLLNRREFMIKAKELIQQENMPISVLMLDVDHFKRINDEYGHAMGDLALQACAKRLKQEIRTDDLLGRIGGEEFAVILPKTDKKMSLFISERLRSAVQEIHFPNDIKLTISIGVICTDGTARFEDLLARADKALYSAKENGRNKSVFAE